MGDLLSIDRRPRARRTPEPLWRDVLGARLRDLRHDSDLTLVEAADRAGISPQYLSEIERGRKDPSSEIVAAVAGALRTSVLELSALVVADLRSAAAVPTSSGPVAHLLVA